MPTSQNSAPHPAAGSGTTSPGSGITPTTSSNIIWTQGSGSLPPGTLVSSGLTAASGTFTGTLTGGLGSLTTSQIQALMNGGLQVNSGASSMNKMIGLSATGPAKTDVIYVVVTQDGSCWELDELQTMTPREMLNIVKLLTLAAKASTSSGSININWSTMIDELELSRHFAAGRDGVNSYPTNTSTAYVFLYDQL